MALQLSPLVRPEDGIENVTESRKFIKFYICSYVNPRAEYVLLKNSSLRLCPFVPEAHTKTPNHAKRNPNQP
jgi:hypothetical protein